MHIKDIELIVSRALKAYKVEKGMAISTAEKWSADHLTEAVSRVNNSISTSKRDKETALSDAFRDLKTWARDLQ